MTPVVPPISTALSRIFVSRSEGEFIVAQWKVQAATMAVTDRTDGRNIANKLQRLAHTDNADVIEQIIALERQLSDLDGDIALQEAEMKRLIYRLYAPARPTSRSSKQIITGHHTEKAPGSVGPTPNCRNRRD